MSHEPRVVDFIPVVDFVKLAFDSDLVNFKLLYANPVRSQDFVDLTDFWITGFWIIGFWIVRSVS